MDTIILLANTLGFLGRALFMLSFYREKRSHYLAFDLTGGALVSAHWWLLANPALTAYSVINSFLSLAGIYYHRGQIQRAIFISLLIVMLASALLVSRTLLEAALGFLFVFIGFTKSRKETKTIFLLQLPLGILLAFQAWFDKSYSSLFFLAASFPGLLKTVFKNQKNNIDHSPDSLHSTIEGTKK